MGWLGGEKVLGILLIWIIVGQGPNGLAVGVGGVVWTFFLSSITSFLSPSLWETTQYRLKYCLKGGLSPKQPTSQPWAWVSGGGDGRGHSQQLKNGKSGWGT